MDTSAAPAEPPQDGRMPVVARHDTVVLGVPAYNEGRFIERTLRSIQQQSHRDFIALISDNASTDDTERACRAFAERDPRFVYVRQPVNVGANDNFIFLRDASKSPFFAWIGGHDTLHPDYVAHHVERLQREPGACGSFTYFQVVDEHDRVLRDEGPEGVAPPDRGPLFRYLWTVAAGEELAPMHGMFRREMLARIPLRRCLAGDHVLIAACTLQGPLRALPGHLYRIRDLDRAPRPQTRMERITGRGGPPVDFHSTVDGYLANFDLFIPPGSRGHGWRPLVRRILMDRYGGKSLRWTKAVRTMIKRLDGVRRLLGGDPLR
jgi:glycosyltransferase involved in cell wall biosynthesis